MKKAIFATVAAMLLGFGASAQLRLGAGVMTGMPMGDWADVNGFGIGGGVSGEYMVTDNIGAGLSAGFMSFSGKDIDLGPFGTIEGNALTMIPIHLQGNYHFMPDEDFNFYGGIGLGLNFISQTVSFTDPFTGTSFEETASTNEFAIVPRVGVNYMFSDMLGLDFNTGYAIVGDLSYLPINLGVIYVLD